MPLNLVPRHMIESFSASSSSARLVSGQTIPGQTLTKVLLDTIGEGTFVDSECQITEQGVYIVSVAAEIDMTVDQHESELHITVMGGNTPTFSKVDSTVNIGANPVTLNGVTVFRCNESLCEVIVHVYVDTPDTRTVTSAEISVEKIA